MFKPTDAIRGWNGPSLKRNASRRADGAAASPPPPLPRAGRVMDGAGSGRVAGTRHAARRPPSALRCTAADPPPPGRGGDPGAGPPGREGGEHRAQRTKDPLKALLTCTWTLCTAPAERAEIDHEKGPQDPGLF